MKKFKLVSAIVALALGVLMLVGVIPVMMGKEGGIVQFFLHYGIGVAAVIMLGIGITQAVKKDLPVSKNFHIVLGVLGIVFQLIAKFIGARFGYFILMISTAYAILILIMELTEMKRQKGFVEKGLAILIAVFAVVYASIYLLLTMFGKFIPNNIENIIYIFGLSVLPALLVAKGVVDIVRSFKPAKQETVAEKVEEPKAEEPAEEKVEEPAEEPAEEKVEE